MAGVRLSILGPDRLGAEPRAAVTDELLALIRANKPVLLAALISLERGQPARRRRALAALDEAADEKRAAIFDIDADPGDVVCTLAIRDVGTCELRMPQDRYDPWALLAALGRTSEAEKPARLWWGRSAPNENWCVRARTIANVDPRCDAPGPTR